MDEVEASDMSGDEEYSDSGQGAMIMATVIHKALENKKKGLQKDYDWIVHQLSQDNMDAQIFYRWLKSLRYCTTDINHKCESLVNATLKIKWIDREESLVDLYIGWLADLVTVHTSFYLDPCLRMLINHFMSSNDSRELTVGENQSFDIFGNKQVHRAMQTVLHLVPSSQTRLLPILTHYFPSEYKPLDQYVYYVSNLLRLTVYAPGLRSQILELTVHKLVKVDVEVSRDSINKINQIFADDEMQFDVDLEMNDSNSADKLAVLPGDLQQIANLADKLDLSMSIFLSYVSIICYQQGKFDQSAASLLFTDLLTAFDTIILPTHDICHIQFYLFVTCSYDEEFVKQMLHLCWNKFEDTNVPAVLRQTSVAYIASFVARAKFVPLRIINTCIEIFCTWIHRYLDEHGNCTTADIDTHCLFYSACQCLFYMIVFKHENLMADEEGKKLLNRGGLQRIVTSKLNPLRFCMPILIKFFAAITSEHELVYCYTIIESNKREQLPTALFGGDKQLTRDINNQLDTFFPFDPYLLSRSAKTIEPLYQSWDDNLNSNAACTKNQQEENEDDDDYLSSDALSPYDCMNSFSPGFGISPARAMMQNYYRARSHSNSMNDDKF
ncbi:RNA polymerase I-specific transcription initiation factor RRN3 [Trichoplax sp. H2]|nr:RNA polymerase I-specific transcription initiation factor RRN3 [Trichoplax sp. H2]|eukprot:RDD38143.1 RNA polymerase I-specific transcription initiation factor RRN3 [Trichoplax sp. H2]